MNTIKSILVLISFLTIQSLVCSAQVSIVVNKGPFDSVEEAAISENRVNFRDENPADERACTECFAATELAKFLPAVTNINAEEKKFPGVKGFPKDSAIFILGSRLSNSLINKFDFPGEMKLETEQSFSIRSLKKDG